MRRIAEDLVVDYASIRQQRFLPLMHRGKVEDIAGKEIDFELHTHRHRSPSSEHDYRAEIRENRSAIESITGNTPTHFCSPSGACHPRFARWLKREGIATAATDWPGTASVGTDPMFLLRILDHSGLSESEFLGWVTGLASWLPHRRPEVIEPFDHPGRRSPPTGASGIPSSLPRTAQPDGMQTSPCLLPRSAPG